MSSTSVYIRGTGDDPVVGATAWLTDIIDTLLAEARSKSALLTELNLEPADRQAAQASLNAFCAERVLRHLAATDQALYAPAAGAGPTRLLVTALRIQHRIITDDVSDLETASTADRSRAAARSLVTMLESCLEIQKSVLLPALAELPGADLPSLVHDMGAVLAGKSLEKPDELDVREIPHGRRHPRIFGTYARLAEGESFVLVNNHDPKPLRREFDAAYPGQYAWDYLEQGPARWRVRIGRPATAR
ncbi:DUF2249 domain-containing protein [Amycolatopsis nalaikhensis]|uniref:DUF2249 domain-containing protein n=1 Tax=Amycolatopsis nalaikhensis TaxID=715472 RepID=A0ABY8XEE0_9PSEU|nr:DUF2249 domain-containing protein [Amycolatopsis sp. 2-2]WIV53983.1 DUF2249 domain-containing protein [Amycolatopsis sp. 2-2]